MVWKAFAGCWKDDDSSRKSWFPRYCSCMIGACYEIMTQGQTQNQENSCKLGNIMWISCMPIGNMIGRDAYLAGQTWDMCTTNNTMRNRWQRMGLKSSNQMTHTWVFPGVRIFAFSQKTWFFSETAILDVLMIFTYWDPRVAFVWSNLPAPFGFRAFDLECAPKPPTLPFKPFCQEWALFRRYRCSSMA